MPRSLSYRVWVILGIDTSELERRKMRREQGVDYKALLQVAIEEARQGLAEGGIPIGAPSLITREGFLDVDITVGCTFIFRLIFN